MSPPFFDYHVITEFNLPYIYGPVFRKFGWHIRMGLQILQTQQHRSRRDAIALFFRPLYRHNLHCTMNMHGIQALYLPRFLNGTGSADSSMALLRVSLPGDLRFLETCVSLRFRGPDEPGCS